MDSNGPPLLFTILYPPPPTGGFTWYSDCGISLTLSTLNTPPSYPEDPVNHYSFLNVPFLPRFIRV